MKTKKKTAAVTSAAIALSMVSYYPAGIAELSSPSGIVYAEEVKTADGLVYVEQGDEAVITGYEGTATDVTIPDKIGDLTVTGIGESAFNDTGITSVTMPSGITEIGDYAFYNCKGLSKITIPSDVKTIGEHAFGNCENLAEAELNDELREIGAYAFSGTTLTEITIPENVTSITYSFSGLKTLKKAAFAGSRTEIPNDAFYNCNGLETIDFPDSLTTIGSEAFYKCEGLKNITFPSGLREIGGKAFLDCKYLTEVEFNDELGEIGAYAFSGTALTEITIPENVTSITYSFSGLKSLKKVTFSGSRTEIPADSFYNCTGLETIVFPDSLTTIGAEAFYKCEGLKKITFPSGIITIGGQAFLDCKYLTEVEFDNELGEIGAYAFSGTALTEITIPENVTSITYSFSGLKSLKKVTFSGSRTEIPADSFYNCTGLETIVFPDSLTAIGAEAFYKCEGFRKIAFPSGLKTIGSQAFLDCKNLTEVEFNDDLAEIKTRAFSGTAIKEISIPESVTVLTSPFSGTDTLRKVSFRGKRTIIPQDAFSYCNYLMEFTVPADTEQIYMSALEGCKSLQTLKVLNPDCVMDGKTKISDYLTIYGHANSTAQKYAEENGYKFALLENAPAEASPSPSPSPVASPDPTPAASPDPTPVSSPDPSPVPTAEPTKIPVEEVDMNEDAVISMADYVVLIKRIITVTDVYEVRYDINKDKKIDATDLIMLRRVFLGTVECY